MLVLIRDVEPTIAKDLQTCWYFIYFDSNIFYANLYDKRKTNCHQRQLYVVRWYELDAFQVLYEVQLFIND